MGRYWLAAGRRAQPDLTRCTVRFHRVSGDSETAVATTPESSANATKAEVTTREPVELTLTGEHGRETVSYEWRTAGDARIRADKLEMPQLTPQPGVFRLRIEHPERDVSFYVGESDNLFRGMGDFRHPGPSPAAARLSELLTRTVRSGGAVKVDLVTAALCSGESLDFSHSWPRELVKNVVVIDLLRDGAVVENK
jgi:hypothetical protein